MPKSQQSRVGNLSPAMGRGIDSRNRVWNWLAKLHRLAGRYDNPMPTWFLAPIAGLKLPSLGSISASSDLVESEWRQMKQCWIRYWTGTGKKCLVAASCRIVTSLSHQFSTASLDTDRNHIRVWTFSKLFGDFEIVLKSFQILKSLKRKYSLKFQYHHLFKSRKWIEKISLKILFSFVLFCETQKEDDCGPLGIQFSLDLLFWSMCQNSSMGELRRTSKRTLNIPLFNYFSMVIGVGGGGGGACWWQRILAPAPVPA